jgi:hypothetical protein
LINFTDVLRFLGRRNAAKGIVGQRIVIGPRPLGGVIVRDKLLC